MNLFLILCCPFDIVHIDVLKSPILSLGGHRYYVLFLDIFTNFFIDFSNFK